MIYERTHKVGLDEVNKSLLMTNRAIIVSIENTASYQTDSIGYGILDIPRTDLTWFVIDWKVQVNKRPKYGDKITIKTWNRDTKDCFSYKDFELYVNDKLYVQATSKWILLNTKTKTYENIPDYLLKLCPNEDNLSTFTERKLNHLEVLDNYDNKSRIYIRKSDLDFNNHVNNVKYFDYLIDYNNAIEYNKFRITYRREIKEDEEVYLYHSKIENKDLYAIIDKDNNIKTIIECE